MRNTTSTYYWLYLYLFIKLLNFKNYTQLSQFLIVECLLNDRLPDIRPCSLGPFQSTLCRSSYACGVYGERSDDTALT